MSTCRAGRHARRRAVGEDHRHRSRSPPDQPFDQSRRPRAAKSPRSTARHSASTRTTPRGTTSATSTTRTSSSRRDRGAGGVGRLRRRGDERARDAGSRQSGRAGRPRPSVEEAEAVVEEAEDAEAVVEVAEAVVDAAEEEAAEEESRRGASDRRGLTPSVRRAAGGGDDRNRRHRGLGSGKSPSCGSSPSTAPLPSTRTGSPTLRWSPGPTPTQRSSRASAERSSARRPDRSASAWGGRVRRPAGARADLRGDRPPGGRRRNRGGAPRRRGRERHGRRPRPPPPCRDRRAAAGTGSTAVLVVDAPEDLAVERVVRDRGTSPGEARARLAAQAEPGARLRAADFIIMNHGTADELAAMVEGAWRWIEDLRAGAVNEAP